MSCFFKGDNSGDDVMSRDRVRTNQRGAVLPALGPIVLRGI